MLVKFAVAVITFAALLIVVNYSSQVLVYHERNSAKPWANGLAYDLGLV